MEIPLGESLDPGSLNSNKDINSTLEEMFCCSFFLSHSSTLVWWVDMVSLGLGSSEKLPFLFFHLQFIMTILPYNTPPPPPPPLHFLSSVIDETHANLSQSQKINNNKIKKYNLFKKYWAYFVPLYEPFAN